MRLTEIVTPKKYQTRVYSVFLCWNTTTTIPKNVWPEHTPNDLFTKTTKATKITTQWLLFIKTSKICWAWNFFFHTQWNLGNGKNIYKNNYRSQFLLIFFLVRWSKVSHKKLYQVIEYYVWCCNVKFNYGSPCINNEIAILKLKKIEFSFGMFLRNS